MCGIAGFISPNNRGAGLSESLRRMTDALTHRGPDDEGQWIDSELGIALGHRRLSILDLSPEGHQPMRSVSERYQLSFNGEIYNFLDLRKELESSNHKFRGHSDTEVMLAAFEQWGVQPAVERFVGMFAFALWDSRERVLHLVRDRLGEKPLYYGWMGDVFLFGSELKALVAHPAWAGEIDRDALALLLRFNYVPTPYCIYKGVFKQQPGTILSLSLDGAPRVRPKEASYWSARHVAIKGGAEPFNGSEEEAVEHLDSLLREAVKQQMVADVPLGAFLSGGIDSSTVVALMQAQSGSPVKTFTIGFLDEHYNEAVHAKAVAGHLGTEHTELYVTPEDAMAVIPKLPQIYDEPFADVSQIPTFLVSKLARRHVTVSLSGDAGDELFGGYRRYVESQNLWKKISLVPGFSRRGLAKAIRNIPVSTLDALFGWASPILNPYGTLNSVGDKLHRATDLMGVKTPDMLYQHLVSHWKNPTSVVSGANDLLTAVSNPRVDGELPNFIERMMYTDTVSYLPDDILVKVDRASMAVSLESRVPFLDHRVVEFAWRLPLAMKVRGRKGKWLVRQLLYRYVPRELVERPKMGFGVPIDSWLRGPLRDWAESLLDETRLKADGFFNPQPIRQKWNEHLRGTHNWQYYLWDVLMFQGWLDDRSVPSAVAGG
jgi:asparagine synthase (glutamine-hydrolysing)